MPDRIKEMGNRVVEWWKHFTKKQQIIMASSVLVVAIAIAILAVVLTRPEMVIIKNCENAKEASSVQTLLNEAGIYNEISDDGLVFKIKKQDMSAANILLGSNSISTENEALKDILNGSMSTTESDKTKLYKEWQEKQMETDLESLSNVQNAIVNLNLPNDDGTLIADQQEASAEVFLELDGEMSEEQALGLARMIATGLGNDTTDNISIMDSNMNLLYSGGMDGTAMASGMSYNQLTIQQRAENRVKNDVKKVLLGTGQYQNVEVGLNLMLDFDDSKTTSKEYGVPEGQAQGPLQNESNFSQETVGGNGDVPGTDANGEEGPNYMLQDGVLSTQTTEDSTKNYAVNETITEIMGGKGEIVYDSSSMAVTVLSYIKYDEDALTRDGTLDGRSFDEFRSEIESQGSQRQDVDAEMITAVSNATGIPEERISIIAYQEPLFVPSEGGRSITDYLEIILAVLIFALLGFVVFMSTRKEKAPEMEPELSVESLLQTTKENEEENLEDIGFKEKSEARVLIEKFVDEKPEAVASLLRNWLNEDWE
ncbi:MAG: flagellar biosynthesis protein [Eubacterium sp.]|nr:flagellar biosynthesis protein [Eubacterium sp.]